MYSRKIYLWFCRSDPSMRHGTPTSTHATLRSKLRASTAQLISREKGRHLVLRWNWLRQSSEQEILEYKKNKKALDRCVYCSSWTFKKIINHVRKADTEYVLYFNITKNIHFLKRWIFIYWPSSVHQLSFCYFIKILIRRRFFVSSIYKFGLSVCLSVCIQ